MMHAPNYVFFLKIYLSIRPQNCKSNRCYTGRGQHQSLEKLVLRTNFCHSDRINLSFNSVRLLDPEVGQNFLARSILTVLCSII